MEKKKPGIFKKATNFVKAVTKHASNDFKKVPIEEYKKRLIECSTCEFHEESKCLKCGCFLTQKAWWQSEDCPIDKWPKTK